MAATRGRGRRPGSPDTRAAILAAARKEFTEGGFRGATVRRIAEAAGVDAALVHHYFGTKRELFLAVLQLPVDPAELLGPALAEGPDGAGERIMRTFLSVWDDPAHRPAMVAMARGMLDPQAGELLPRGFLAVVMEPLGETMGLDNPRLRMHLVASQIVGLVLTRYLFALEPLASMSREAVVAAYAPTIQRYLTGEV